MHMVRPIQNRAPPPPGASRDELSGAPLGGTRSEAMRRLQMGGIGIVAVVVLIGLASIIENRAKQSDSTVVAEAVSSQTAAPTTPAADPLAQAGVVPDMPASPSPTASGLEGSTSPATPSDAE